MGRFWAVFSLSLCLLALALAGCAGGSIEVSALPQVLRDAALPAPTEILRQAAYAEAERERAGASFDAAIEAWNVERDGVVAVFAPYWVKPDDTDLNDAAYAYYPFQLDGYAGAAELLLTWDTAPVAQTAFVGLANFTRNRWDWRACPETGALDFGGLTDYIEPASGLFAVVVLTLGTDSSRLASLRIGPPIVPQQAPTAQLSADQLSGAPPIDIQFDTALSVDPDGTIALYEIDKNNDGAFEDSSATPPAWSQHFSTEGLFTVTLRVTDDAGLSDMDQLTISTSADSGWVGVIIPGITTPPAPIWDADGLPAVAYMQGVYLSLIRAQNTLGQTWDSPLDIYFTGSGAAPSAALVNGRPAIAFETVGATTFQMSFIMASDAAGTHWGPPIGVATSPGYPSMAGNPQLFEVAGRPAILYMSEISGWRELYFFRATDSTGISWGEGVVVGPDDIVGFGTPRIIDGNPAVAFVWRNTAENRYEYGYARATQSDGSEWGLEVPLLALAPGTPGDVSYGCDLLDAGGRPAVVYCSYAIPFGAKDVSFLRANDATGASWPASAATVYSAAGANDYLKWPAMATIGGNPAVVFEEWSPDTNGRLVYCRAEAPDGSSWGPVEEVTRVDTGVLHEDAPFDKPKLGLSGGLPAVVCNGNEGLFLTRR